MEDHQDCLVVSVRVVDEGSTSVIHEDAGLALITRICHMLYGDKFWLSGVNFRREKPKSIKPYFQFFGCSMEFGQAQNQLLIPLSIVDETLEGAHPGLALLNDKLLMHRLANIDRNDIVARVRATLVEQLPDGDTTDESVAKALHMSTRTLHRKLRSSNRSYRSVVVETRQQLASHYIKDMTLTLTEISLLLGFSEASSFTRAFKNWTDSTPTQMRQTRL